MMVGSITRKKKLLYCYEQVGNVQNYFKNKAGNWFNSVHLQMKTTFEIVLEVQILTETDFCLSKVGRITKK